MASLLPTPRLIPPTHSLSEARCLCSHSFLTWIALPRPLLPTEIVPLKMLSDALFCETLPYSRRSELNPLTALLVLVRWLQAHAQLPQEPMSLPRGGTAPS